MGIRSAYFPYASLNKLRFACAAHEGHGRKGAFPPATSHVYYLKLQQLFDFVFIFPQLVMKCSLGSLSDTLLATLLHAGSLMTRIPYQFRFRIIKRGFRAEVASRAGRRPAPSGQCQLHELGPAVVPICVTRYWFAPLGLQFSSYMY